MMHNKSFLRLLIGQTLANLGDVFYIVALISSIYTTSNSLFFVSLVPVISMLSGFLGSLVAPYFIDKFSSKFIVVYSQLFKTIIFVILILSVFFIGNNILIIYPLIFLVNFLDGFANPVSTALIPSIVSEDELVKANSIMSSVYQFTKVGSWAIGGIIVSMIGSFNTFILTVILYGLSTLVLSILQIKSFDLQKEEKSKFSDGWNIIIKEPLIRSLHLIIFLQAIVSPVWISAILYPFIENHLQVDLKWWGYINTALLIGLFLGGIITYLKSNWLENKIYHTLIISASFIVVAIGCFGFNHYPLIALVIIFSYGMMQEINSIVIEVILQSNLKEKILAKVYAAQGAIIMLTVASTTLIYGIIGEIVPVNFIYYLAGIASFIALILSIFLKNKLKYFPVGNIKLVD